MKKSTLVLLIATMILPSLAGADVYVRGSVDKNGVYRQPHMRSNPDSSRYNNYSTQGNTNPYTGRTGNVNPERSYTQPQYGGYAPRYNRR